MTLGAVREVERVKTRLCRIEFYGKLDDDTYREVKQDANRQVDEFLLEHRKKTGNEP